MNADSLAAQEDAIFVKAAWRLIPFLGLLYVVNFLDRVNVGFAALTMNKDIGLGEEAYGWGAGIFFIGYFIFEVPSNVWSAWARACGYSVSCCRGGSSRRPRHSCMGR